MLGGAGLPCFLSRFRLRSRSCRSCCARRYCGVEGGRDVRSVVVGGVVADSGVVVRVLVTMGVLGGDGVGGMHGSVCPEIIV